MSLHESGEMYLETIYVLLKKGDVVRSLDVAEYMNFSKPSVSRAMGLLKTGGFVEVDAEGHLSLTKAGKEVASKTYERHEILTEFFVSLGVPEETAMADACKIEHDISDTSFEAVKKHMGR